MPYFLNRQLLRAKNTYLSVFRHLFSTKPSIRSPCFADCQTRIRKIAGDAHLINVTPGIRHRLVPACKTVPKFRSHHRPTRHNHKVKGFFNNTTSYNPVRSEIAVNNPSGFSYGCERTGFRGLQVTFHAAKEHLPQCGTLPSTICFLFGRLLRTKLGQTAFYPPGNNYFTMPVIICAEFCKFAAK